MKVRIGVWMTVWTLSLVLLVVAAVAPGGFVLLRQLASDATQSRLQLAAVGAAEGLEHFAQQAQTSAQLLAERPTLARLMQDGDHGELINFLEKFRRTSELDCCALLRNGAVIGAAPEDARWPSGLEEGLSYFEPQGEDSPFLVATATLHGHSDAVAAVLLRLDPALARAIGTQVGLPVSIFFAERRAESGAWLEADAWRARREVQVAIGGRALVVEVCLPADEAAAPLQPLQRNFALLTALAAVVAVVAGLFATRSFARPLAELRAAAMRIGAGDWSTPVPPASGLETGALAATMEEMRQRVGSAAAQLREREAEASALLENIVEGVFAVDSERKIRYVNSRAAKLLGGTPELLLGRFCGDVLRPVRKGGARPCENNCPIVKARQSGAAQAVEQLQQEQGLRSMVLTSAPPAGGRQVQLLRDETEAESVRRSRDAVLANVSHELRTPLSAQLASLEMLRDVLEAQPEHAQALELASSLERSTLRLTRLIDNLLESVSIETGQSSLRRVPVDLAAVVRDAAASLLPLLRQRGQTLQVDLPRDLEPVAGDAIQLAQVFVNLFANAHKFAPANSQIRVWGRREEHGATLWVDDSGPGIPPKEQQRVFEHYYRAQPGNAEGMGLGLWIVKSIVERHGGSVEASSSPQGGARFCVYLPAGSFA